MNPQLDPQLSADSLDQLGNRAVSLFPPRIRHADLQPTQTNERALEPLDGFLLRNSVTHHAGQNITR